MVQCFLKLTKKGWKEVKHSDFWIDRPLLRRLEALRYIQKKNWDGVIIIDGKERSGKSVLGMIMGWYLTEGKMGINNFARGLEDAARKIATLPDRSVLMMDEGSLIFSSKDSTGSPQKKLIKLMDVVGQKNMIFIICLPCFFDLNKTIAVRRSLFLCHVYPDAKYNRGDYVFWGESKKKVLYQHGKKHFDSYAFPRAEFVGNFFNFEPPFYKDYINIVKKESLDEVMKDALNHKGKSADQMVIETEALIYGWLIENKILKNKEICNIKGQGKSTISERINLYKRLIGEKPLENEPIVVRSS